METDVGATWLMKPANAHLLCNALSPGLNIKQRKFNMFVNASTALDPENADHLKEIAETNNIQNDTLIAMCWGTAHLILTFSNADDAN